MTRLELFDRWNKRMAWVYVYPDYHFDIDAYDFSIDDMKEFLIDMENLQREESK